MGIKELYKIITDNAPSAKTDKEISDFSGKTIAIDTSMCLYQYVNGYQNATGVTDGHIKGIFDTTIRMIVNGIKPVYVFDGKPPDLKSAELIKREAKREKAQTARVTKQHNAEIKELLALMGVPCVTAPSEAEAQCAAMVKAGKAYATATEDSDALVFGSNRLIRHLTHKNEQIQKISTERILSEMEFTKEQFVDLCILLGCDYCETIRGIGPKRALELVSEHKCIEEVLKNIDKKKYIVPEDWNYEQARQLFMEPEVTDPKQIDLKWKDPDVEKLVKFVCVDRQFDEKRIRGGCKMIMKTRTTSTQGRLDSFFKVLPSTPNSNNKRKLDAGKIEPPKKKVKAATTSKTGTNRKDLKRKRAAQNTTEEKLKEKKEKKEAAHAAKIEAAHAAKVDPYPTSKRSLNAANGMMSFATFSGFMDELTKSTNRLVLLSTFLRDTIERHPNDLANVIWLLLEKDDPKDQNGLFIVYRLIAELVSKGIKKVEQDARAIGGFSGLIDKHFKMKRLFTSKPPSLNEVTQTIENMNQITPKKPNYPRIADCGHDVMKRFSNANETKNFAKLVQGLRSNEGFTHGTLFEALAKAYVRSKELTDDLIEVVKINI